MRQVVALRATGGERDGAAVSRCGLAVATGSPEEVGTSGVVGLVSVEAIAGSRGQSRDELEARCRTVDARDRDRAVQADHVGRRQRFEGRVERGDLTRPRRAEPVLHVERGDRRLDLVRPDAPALEGPAQLRQPCAEIRLVPERRVLLFERYEDAFHDARVAAGGAEQQRERPRGSGSSGQRRDDAREPDRFGAERGRRGPLGVRPARLKIR